MIEFESREMIAVLGIGQQSDRVSEILRSTAAVVSQFQSIDELRQSGSRPYAVVIVSDSIDTALNVSLQYLRLIEHVVLISRRANEMDTAAAFYAGAHFVFDIDEPDRLLTARLNAALRSYGAKTLTTIIAPPYKFDVERRQVFLGNKSIALSPKEYQFAEYVFSRPGKTIPKSELMLSVWSLPRKSDARRVDTAACRVRKKMQLCSRITGWQLIYRRRAGFELSLQNAG